MTRPRCAPAGVGAASFPEAAPTGRPRTTAPHPSTGDARKPAEATA